MSRTARVARYLAKACVKTGDLQTAARLHALADHEDQKPVHKTISADAAAIVKATVTHALRSTQQRAVTKADAPSSFVDAVNRIVKAHGTTQKSSADGMQRVVANAAVRAQGGRAALTKDHAADRDGSLVRQALADLRRVGPR